MLVQPEYNEQEMGQTLRLRLWKRIESQTEWLYFSEALRAPCFAKDSPEELMDVFCEIGRWADVDAEPIAGQVVRLKLSDNLRLGSLGMYDSRIPPAPYNTVTVDFSEDDIPTVEYKVRRGE